MKEQDRYLPIANVGRMMKKAVPANAKISKDAKEFVQEAVSEFIAFTTGEASERCKKEKRKTISGKDIIIALEELGFDDYLDPLNEYLGKFKELTRQESREKVVSNLNEEVRVFPLPTDAVRRQMHPSLVSSAGPVPSQFVPASAPYYAGLQGQQMQQSSFFQSQQMSPEQAQQNRVEHVEGLEKRVTGSLEPPE